MTGSIIAKKDSLSGTYLAHRLLTITFFVWTFGLLNLNAISVSSWTLFNIICRTESFSFLCTICVTGTPVSPATPALFFGWERKNIKFCGLPKGTIREEAFIRCYLQGIGTTASRGVLQGILGGGGPPGFPKIDPISVQKVVFSTSVFRPGL